MTGAEASYDTVTNSIGACSALMFLREKKEKSYCLQKVFQEQMNISNLLFVSTKHALR